MIVGLTGGIGSGKTTVAKAFLELGIPVYIADDEAKKLMLSSKIIKKKLKKLFGDQAYTINGALNKPFIAAIIFNDKAKLNAMNAIVHPKVAMHFNRWYKRQHAPYVIKEVAILFENGGHTLCDYIITVVAPLAQRMERLLKRDNTTVENIESIVKNQWEDEKKMALSHFVIDNTSFANIKPQVLEIHASLLKLTR